MSQSAVKKIGWAFIATAFTLAVIAGALYFSPLDYVVYADGDPRVVSGSFETVEEVVTAAGIVLQPADILSPEADDPASPAIPIQFQTAREVQLTVDGQSRAFVSSAPTISRFFAENGVQLLQTDRVYAGSRLLSRPDLSSEPLPEVIHIERLMSLTVVDGESRTVVQTAAQTVGEALAEAGIVLFTPDRTTPPLAAGLAPDLTITLHRAAPVTIQVDGQMLESRSTAETVGQLLAETGIGLVGYDYTIPSLDAPVTPGLVVQLIRVNETFVIEEGPIPFESLLQPTSELEIDQRALLQNGIPGVERRRLRIRFENGVEVSQIADARWVAQEPVDEIVGYGTTIVLRTVETEQGPREYWRKVTMRVTSYMAQTSGKPKDHPGYGITASGVVAGYGVVAIDPRVVPFRSELFVPGYGVGFAGDTGGGVKGRWIDLGYEDSWDTFKSWNGTVEVYYLTPIPENINYLIPRNIP